MRIAIPKEIKPDENRVALTPQAVRTLILSGAVVTVESGAGMGSGFTDAEYRAAGAEIIEDRNLLFAEAELVVKVKEPEPEEYPLFRSGQMLFTYLHLAASRSLTEFLCRQNITAIAYETVQLPDGSLPLLTPMSEVAGRMSVQIGAHFLEARQGGRGIMLGGVPGVPAGDVVILGAGVVGSNAARIAVGLGANVTVLDVRVDRLRYLEDIFQGKVTTLMSSHGTIAEAVRRADLLIGAVLIPGARAPHLVTEDMVKQMKPGSVIVDVAIDQGGAIETSDHVTTHENPVYVKHGVIHYAVANIPGAVPRTSTYALTNVTLPYILKLVKHGFDDAVRKDEALRKGVNVHLGKVRHRAVAEAHDMTYEPLDDE